MIGRCCFAGQMPGRSLAFLLKSHSRTLSTSSAPTVWIISAGDVAGDKQAMALATIGQLGKPIKKNIVPSKRISWLYPVFQKIIMDRRTNKLEKSEQFDKLRQLQPLPWYLESPSNDVLSEPLPDYVISSCPSTTLAALQVKAASRGATKAIHLQQPFVNMEVYDALVIQKHLWPLLALSSNLSRSGSVIGTKLCLNGITSEALEQAARNESVLPAAFYLPDKESPIFAVLISAMHNINFTWFSDETRRLVQQLDRLYRVHNARIAMTFTRKTPETVRGAIRQWAESVQDSERVYLWDGTGENPYETMLARATHIAVTADSMMMTSEALMCRKPVYIIGTNKCKSDLQKFHKSLVVAGHARPFLPSRLPPDVDLDFGVVMEENSEGEDPFSDIGDHKSWQWWRENETADAGRAIREMLSSK
ncbi:mitochondrial fission ELM1-domain-containing protein [Polychytrium aggregatum]|uniref:mitochondrial fission ELM1-domain-containing protein n=1 Tax=Polychytrium aggregatum TaxID=110093 RepID=UPI0022FDCC34|nr:mitochondrial fission ELM1-domain-containing protein [Polychytrium aggregatum]KAI9206335.1 mitochondrial fission ELM1-domain-containing protein [Polychytrium aggregatum]